MSTTLDLERMTSGASVKETKKSLDALIAFLHRYGGPGRHSSITINTDGQCVLRTVGGAREDFSVDALIAKAFDTPQEDTHHGMSWSEWEAAFPPREVQDVPEHYLYRSAYRITAEQCREFSESEHEHACEVVLHDGFHYVIWST